MHIRKTIYGLVSAFFLLTITAAPLLSAPGYDPRSFPGQGSEADFNKALQLNEKGVVLLKSSKALEAIAEFKKAIDIYPYYAQSFANYGNALSNQHRYAEAIRQYKKAIALAPDFTEAYCKMAESLLQQKNYLAAEAACKNALKIESMNLPAMLTLADVYLVTHKAQDARTVLLAAQNLPASPAQKKAILDKLSKTSKLLSGMH